MADEPVTEPGPTPPDPEKAAKKALDDAVFDLGRVAHGTTLEPTINFQLVLFQVDELVGILCDTGVLSRVAYWDAITKRVREMESEVRRAVLGASGGPAGQAVRDALKKKAN